MNNEQLPINDKDREKRNNLYSLIPIDEFKLLFGVDDRDDKLIYLRLMNTWVKWTLPEILFRKNAIKKRIDYYD